ncbi:MAG: ExeA family protein [Gammaproteobacteria bacterium]
MESEFCALYNHYFNFTEQPFSIAPDPHFIYMSERHQEGLAHLLYGIETGGGFVALTGEVGTGKTTLCRCLLQQLPERIDMALILNPRLNAIELLASLCDELGIAYAKDSQTLKYLVDALNHHLLKAHAEGRRTVLMIDEAQNLSFEVLEQLRLLTNLETNKTKLLQIILVGQPELRALLGRPELRQLNQRITARYHLLPLSLDDTRAYIRHRLALCNGNPKIFKETAIRKVYKLSNGVPRIINIVCDRALLGAYATGKRLITPAIVAKASAETLNGGDKSIKRRTIVLTVVLALCLTMAGYYHFGNPVWISETRVYLAGALPVKDEPVVPVPAEDAAEEPDPSQKGKISPSLFDAYIDSPERTLPFALAGLLKAWGKPTVSEVSLDCSGIEAFGLQCLTSLAQWHDILFLDRTVIMEFPMPDGSKHYAHLTGIHNGLPVFEDNPELKFSVPSVLNRWEGRYWMLIESPAPEPNTAYIYPHQQSEAVLWLRRQLDSIDGVSRNSSQPRLFDDELKARVLTFQRKHQLNADGLVGPNTIEQLIKYTVPASPPQLKVSD